MTIAAFAGAKGLGWLISLGLNGNDPNLVLLGAIPASILALLVDLVLSTLEKVVTAEGLKSPEKIVLRSRAQKRRRALVAAALCTVLLTVPVGSAAAGALDASQKRITVGTSNFTEAIVLGLSLIHISCIAAIRARC